MKFRTMIEHSRVRLMFVRFLYKSCGMNMQTAYAKIRECRVKKWEALGIDRCIREYAPSYRGRKREFYDSDYLHLKKMDFRYFMEEKGMCASTVERRFRAWNFEKWELRGLDTLWDRFLAANPDALNLLPHHEESDAADAPSAEN